MYFLRTSLALATIAALLACPVCANASHRKSATHSAGAAGHAATHSAAASHSGSAHHASSTHASAGSHATAGKAATGSKSSRNARRNALKPKRLRGQQAIQPERVTEIQQALIREHYLTKEADGLWDAETEAAMQKYQADQGWQTKLMPDSRAIKKLGLGPDYSNAINAKSANFGGEGGAGAIPTEQASGFATASGVNR